MSDFRVPIFSDSHSEWKPYNQVGRRILVRERPAEVIAVEPPQAPDEVERITVKFEDGDEETEVVSVRGIRIGGDWIK